MLDENEEGESREKEEERQERTERAKERPRLRQITPRDDVTMQLD